jgi:uncharacterized paraquat-inducible protein A
MIQRLLTWWRGEDKQQYFTCRCQHCQQKIRFRPEKAGTHSLCPRCRRSIKLPLENSEVGRVGSAAAGHRLVGKSSQ